MAFLLNSQGQGLSGKNEQSTQTPWRGGAPEARGPMQLHRLKATLHTSVLLHAGCGAMI